MYFSKGIDFVYESRLIFPENVVLHSDFAVYVSSENCVKFHEHIGNLPNKDYERSFQWKMDMYIRNGFIPMRNLILTFEDENGNVDME